MCELCTSVWFFFKLGTILCKFFMLLRKCLTGAQMCQWCTNTCIMHKSNVYGKITKKLPPKMDKLPRERGGGNTLIIALPMGMIWLSSIFLHQSDHNTILSQERHFLILFLQIMIFPLLSYIYGAYPIWYMYPHSCMDTFSLSIYGETTTTTFHKCKEFYFQ